MSTKCLIRNFKHQVTVPTGFKLYFSASFCTNGLHELKVADKGKENTKDTLVPDEIVAKLTVKWLDSYFAVRSSYFEDDEEIPPICNFALRNGKGESNFERNVWEALRNEIPPGKVVTYGKLAEMANPQLKEGEGKRYARAVGNIMRSNPFCLLRPCHRVVPSNWKRASNDGDKTSPANYGFYGGVAESEIKKHLLEFELKHYELKK